MRRREINWKTKGSASLLTIAILFLVISVIVGFFSLSVVTFRTSRLDWAQEEARANARLGLMIAIGELQRDLGPDRRIAVTGSIMDSDPETQVIEGVRNRHWTGVVSTVFEGNKNGSPFTRDIDSAGLRDARWGTSYRLRDHVKNYLVSGNEGGPQKMNGPHEFQDALTSEVPSGEEAVDLVSSGSAVDPLDHVRVFKTKISVPRPPHEKRRGSQWSGGYGYWVYPNNQKASLGILDRHRDEKINERNGAGIQRMLHPQEIDPSVMEGIGSLQHRRDDRLLTPETLILVNEDNRYGVRKNFHELTGYSSSVLANVRDGGLKKNLSAFLHGHDNGGPPEFSDITNPTRTCDIGISPQDRLIGSPNASYAALRGEDFRDSKYREVAPTFELLWHWANLANEFRFGETSTILRPRGRWMSDPTSSQNRRPIDPRIPSQVKIAPVVTEACVYYNLATYPLEGSGHEGPGEVVTPGHVLRLCLYPRVGIWNPYNVEMSLDRPLMMQLSLHGKKRVEFDGDPGFSREIHFGGRSEAFDDWMGGQLFLTLPPVVLPPGATLIFSMAGPPRELKPGQVEGNDLQSTEPPSSSSYLFRDYLQTDLEGAAAENAGDFDEIPSEIMPVAPTTFREAPIDFKRHGADNFMFLLKSLETNPENPTPASFAGEPMLVCANVSLQAGGGDEYPLEWPPSITAPVHRLGGPADHLGDGFPPHPFTRDGFRIRWLDETQSNKGKNDGPFLQEAPLGNWNLRASHVLRNPFDNVTSRPPYFHGIYTRDQPGEELDWNQISPFVRDGNQTGFPFGPGEFEVPRLIAFEVPTREVGIPSLAYLRHVPLSEFVWQPAYAIGNAGADPRIGTSSTIPSRIPGKNHGWSAEGLGTSYWAALFNELVFHLSENNHLVHDLSFEVNHNLWSDYFLTGATPDRIANFAKDPIGSPLGNGNLRLWNVGDEAASNLNDFFRAAGHLLLDGGFDVHSTNKEAWKALLSATRNLGYGSRGRTPFPRILFPKGEENDNSEYSAKVFGGYRSLGEQEIDSLAEAIVREVKVRAPFFGLSDFVNRRLTDNETGRNGVLGAALESSLPNRGLKARFPINREPLPDQGPLVAEGNPRQTDLIRSDPALKPPSTAYGLPGYLTQGDILQVIGSGLVARSDTFLIRSYGESLDRQGEVLARCWCEAVVQRTPLPLLPDKVTGLNPRPPEHGRTDFGRRFEIVSFRWLHPDEV